MYKIIQRTLSIIAVLIIGFFVYTPVSVHAQVDNPQDGSVGMQGTIPSDPPSQAATISFPSNGASFSETPIEISGLCPQDTLIKIYKNDIFSGSVQCAPNGTYSIFIDLFNGTNEIVARVFDALDQEGPVSNTVTVTYDDGSGVARDVQRPLITTEFAKRGAPPGEELTWPLTLTGGVPPYAVSVDWGDGTTDLISLNNAGEFEISHIYERPGTYKVIIRVTDSNGTTTFLQLVAVATGDVTGTIEDGLIDTDGDGIPDAAVRERVVTVVPWWPFALMFILILSTFWLGRRYEIRKMKKRLSLQGYR